MFAIKSNRGSLGYSTVIFRPNIMGTTVPIRPLQQTHCVMFSGLLSTKCDVFMVFPKFWKEF